MCEHPMQYRYFECIVWCFSLFLVPFLSCLSGHSPYLSGIAHKGGHYISRWATHRHVVTPLVGVRPPQQACHLTSSPPGRPPTLVWSYLPDRECDPVPLLKALSSHGQPRGSFGPFCRLS